MRTNEYLIYSLKNELPKKLKWFYATMSITPTDNEYVKIDNNKYLVDINGTWVPLDDGDIKRPIFVPADIVEVDKETMPNIEGETVTTLYGRCISNYLLLVIPFKDKIKYINKQFSIKNVESLIVPLLESNKITVDEYLLFVDCVTLLQGISNLVTMSATPKNMVAPPGLNAFKQKLRAAMIKKYGPNWDKSQLHIVEYKKKLSEYDDEWLRDDPTNNKIVCADNKVKTNARSKMYLTFGAEQGFDSAGADAVMLDNSLTDGYTKDKEKLAMVFNSCRVGSYSRGKETQKGGAVAKDVLRATSSITIKTTDCKSTIYKEIVVTPEISEGLIGRYMRTSRGIEEITDPKSLIGKTIEIRSPLYCKLGGKYLCSVCCGKRLEGYESGVSLLVTDISGTILKSSLKLMHNTQKKAVLVDINDIIKD